MEQMEIAYTFGDFQLTDYSLSSIMLYIDHGIEPGSFMSAVLCNDLRLACMQADYWNIRNIPAYISFLYNWAPSGCWGQEDKFVAWIEEGGLIGKGLPTRKWNVASQIMVPGD